MQQVVATVGGEDEFSRQFVGISDDGGVEVGIELLIAIDIEHLKHVVHFIDVALSDRHQRVPVHVIICAEQTHRVDEQLRGHTTRLPQMPAILLDFGFISSDARGVCTLRKTTWFGHGRTINSEFSVWRGVVDGQAKNRHAGIRQPRSPLHPHAQLDGIRQYRLIDPARPCHHLRSQEWPDRFQMTGRRRNRRAVSPRMACR